MKRIRKEVNAGNYSFIVGTSEAVRIYYTFLFDFVVIQIFKRLLIVKKVIYIYGYEYGSFEGKRIQSLDELPYTNELT